VWYRTRTEELRRTGLEEQYDLSDALAIATWLNILLRHCRTVEIANYAQMVNVIAPIFTQPDALFLQTVYHPLRLYAEHHQPVVLDAYVDSPPFELTPEQESLDTSPAGRDWKVSDLGPFQLLDVSASCDSDIRVVCVAVVNRSRDEAIPARITVDGHTFGSYTAHVVNGADAYTRNSFETPEAVSVDTSDRSEPGAILEYTFPAHSVVVIKGELHTSNG